MVEADVHVHRAVSGARSRRTAMVTHVAVWLRRGVGTSATNLERITSK